MSSRLGEVRSLLGRECVLLGVFRYRRPSLKTLLGVTKAKKRLKKELGITALLKPAR